MKTMTSTTVTQQIEAAVAAVDDERECLEDERIAFARFRKRIAPLDVHPPTNPTTTTKIKDMIVGASSPTASATQTEQVRNAYSETVMSVPHYDEDYDQSLNDHLAAEFTSELAGALATTDSLTPSLHETLLTGSQQAKESRSSLLDMLDRETDSLQHARETLNEMYTSLVEMNQQPITAWSTTEIISTHERLQEFETQCDELAAQRQAELNSQRVRRPNHTDEQLNEYLYASLPVTYPVLSDLAEFASLVSMARQRLEQALITR